MIDHLAEISDLAERIYAAAAPLDKKARHEISNAAKLIQWLAYDQHKPGDQDSAPAIERLRRTI